jgi:DNA-3-methyladenine glycosylase II
MTTRSTRSAAKIVNGDVAKEDGTAETKVCEDKSRLTNQCSICTQNKTQGVKIAKADAKRRASKVDGDNFKVPEAPQTPNKRRKTPSQPNIEAPPAPTTPTPSLVGLIAGASSNPRRKPASTRKAAPNATNAPLQTPGGSRIVAYPSDLFEAPSSQNPGEASLTTGNLLQKACEHLVKVDPRFKVVIDKHHCKMFSPEGLQEEVEPFTALASGIMGQQVSGAAAASIKKKFVALFDQPDTPNSKYFPTPADVITKDIATLRTAGLSQRKAEYIHGLAEKFVAGELSARMLIEASDEEVLEKLIAVRGLGRWSVEMFACFALKRTDIFSTGDLGVQYVFNITVH